MVWNSDVQLIELVQIVPAFAPVDMSASSGPVSDWVSLKDYRRCMIVYSAAVGTAANDSTITLLQATDVAGDNPKALNFAKLQVKQAVDISGVGQFTETANPTGDNSYTSDTSGESQLVWVIEIMAENLDIDGGFTCIQASVNDHGAAKVGGINYILYDARYIAAPMPDATVN